jgi:3-oxoacyl-[acyl-carrier-protein] synthase-3
VVGTISGDMPLPACAAFLQQKLGITTIPAFDIAAACAGFVYGLSIADQFIKTGMNRCVLVVGVELLSRVLNWQDRTTCVLFGDGAGAVVLEAQNGTGTRADRGILTTHLRSDGRYKAKLYVDGGPSSTQTVGHLRMEGRAVFKHAVAMVTDVIEDAFKATGYTADDVDWFVPHQANKRIIDDTAKKLGISPAKVVTTVDRHGNTSAASIPLALTVAVADGRIKRGDLVMLEAMGGGFTWGSALVRW